MTRKVLKTSFDYPPIPVRDHDWSAWFDGDEEDGLYGYGATEEEAIASFLEQLACADELDPAFREHAMDWLKPEDIKRGIETMLARLGPPWLTDAQIADVLLDAQARQRDHDALAAESRAIHAKVKP